MKKESKILSIGIERFEPSRKGHYEKKYYIV